MRLWILLAAAALLATLCPGPAGADGVLEAMSGVDEVYFSLLSTATTDASGETTKTETLTYGARTTFTFNYKLLPTVSLNAGSTYEKNIANLASGPDATESEVTRFRPYLWLTLRDPVLGAAVGYALADDSVKTSGQEATTLTRETYSAKLDWRPSDFPSTQARYTRTWTRDDPRFSLDTEQDQVYLKSEYGFRDFNAYYAGTYVTTLDNIRNLETRQISHEGKLGYATSVLDGRISLTSDNRLRVTELTSDNPMRFTGLDSAVALSLPAAAGLSALDDTPVNDPLLANAALVDGDTTASAGVNIGFPGLGGDFRRRNVGLDLGTAVALNRLHVWADGFGAGPLPADIAGWFSWEIYTSTDNLTWALHATVPGALFGPFDRRFEIAFAAVTTRYIKAVTRPLPGGIIGATNSTLFPNIFITEVQAFADTTTQGQKARNAITQTVRTHNLELKAVLFRAPLLYYRFSGSYEEFDPGAEPRYSASNGLFFNHRFHPIFSVSANASFEIGREREETRTAILYYAALAATPLPTLTDSLLFSGNRQWTGETTTTSNSVILYNTAQLYRGIDVTLQLGGVLTSNEDAGGVASERRDLYVNVGTGITPHRTLTMTAYYLGRVSRSSGDVGEESESTENRLDLGLSFTPVPTLFLSATVNIVSEAEKPAAVTQNYGLNWAPFPDGNLQFGFFYAESQFADETTSRVVQPSLRWYLSSRRRAFLEASYAWNTTESPSSKTESSLFSTRLQLYF